VATVVPEPVRPAPEPPRTTGDNGAGKSIKPFIAYDMGGKFDRSFNQSAYAGLDRWRRETGLEFGEFEIANPAQREQALRRAAERGFSPIIAAGYSYGPAMESVAKQFPTQRFVIIDSVVNSPNVQSAIFKEHEGSFLVGVAAASASRSGRLGFIGGMDIPLLRKFRCGFEQGARWANNGIQFYGTNVGTSVAAWNDPGRGAELARSQFSNGVDVIYAVAGGSGVGVYQAAKDAGKLAIGVDSNQNHLQPGTMLTSMVKRVDNVVYQAVKNWTPGTVSYGLKEGAVDWALDEHNRKLISNDMQGRIESAKQDIASGRIRVVDPLVQGSCPI